MRYSLTITATATTKMGRTTRTATRRRKLEMVGYSKGGDIKGNASFVGEFEPSI